MQAGSRSLGEKPEILASAPTQTTAGEALPDKVPPPVAALPVCTAMALPGVPGRRDAVAGTVLNRGPGVDRCERSERHEDTGAAGHRRAVIRDDVRCGDAEPGIAEEHLRGNQLNAMTGVSADRVAEPDIGRRVKYVDAEPAETGRARAVAGPKVVIPAARLSCSRNTPTNVDVVAQEAAPYDRFSFLKSVSNLQNQP